MNWQNNDIDTLTSQLPGVTLPWIKDLRQQQWQAFLHHGIPTRQHEAWKYTDISTLKQLNVNNSGSPFTSETLSFSPVDLPDGVIVNDLQSALETHADYVKKAFSKYQNSSLGLLNFNTSLWGNGVFIYIPDDVVIDKPIMIHYRKNNSDINIEVFRNLIFCGKRSRVTIMENFSSESDAPYWQQRVTQIELDEYSQLNHIQSQNEGINATHISDTLIEQLAHSVYCGNSFSIGGKLQRQAWQVNLLGEKARSSCRGLSIVNGAQHSDYHVTMNHAAKSCVSEQQFKAIANDKARAIYNGKVIVQATGQQAVAHQQSRNLLLSSNAEIDTRPELEIYTDDVKCSHGASVGQIDAEQLFYLQSRGISADQAKEILLHAFIYDQLDELTPDIEALVMPIIEAKLATINGGHTQ
ncbi:MAG: Fe-S cluster assembly protein SufD [Gammaproteobacteria bacterium]|nr:Fe-S cluster assembly protein SufD [Gammaproteobacteria bacterium]